MGRLQIRDDCSARCEVEDVIPVKGPILSSTFVRNVNYNPLQAIVHSQILRMALASLCAGLLPAQSFNVSVSLDSRPQYSAVFQMSNRGGFASCSQAHGTQGLTCSHSKSHKTRDFKMQAAAVLEPEIAAPDSAKPSSAGDTSHYGWSQTGSLNAHFPLADVGLV